MTENGTRRPDCVSPTKSPKGAARVGLGAVVPSLVREDVLRWRFTEDCERGLHGFEILADDIDGEARIEPGAEGHVTQVVLPQHVVAGMLQLR